MTAPAIPGLTRHFATIGQRQVHYRRMGPKDGSGPPIIAIHRLPRSSKHMVPFMQTAAEKFTVIAPDLAGYGNSWQLPPPPVAQVNYIPPFREYVDDIDNLVKELGITRAALYGEGEGAAVAFQLVMRDPKRFVCAALDGLMLLSDTEIAVARRSLPAFEPKWDGSHFAWLWAFLREENCFSPWWTARLDTRIDKAMPDAAELQQRLVQFLADGRLGPGPMRAAKTATANTDGGQLGRGYHLGIISALDFKPKAHLPNVNVPMLFTGSPTFHKHVSLARLSSPSKNCSFKLAPNLIEARAAAVEFLAANIGRANPPPPAPPAKPIPHALWEDFVPAKGGQLHVQMNDDVSTVPLLVQHDAASSVGTVEPISKFFIGRRTVLAFDLPGSGESDNTIGEDGIEVHHYAEVLQSVLETFGLEKVDFYGMWGGGFVGLEMALMPQNRIRRLVMSNVFQHEGEERQKFLDNYTPPIEPVWHGGHLLQCWQQMRDQGIYYPWFDRTAAGVIKREPYLDVSMIHERVCSMLKAGNMYRTAYQAHFRYPTYEKLKQSPVPTLIATTKWDPNNPHTQAAAKAAPDAKFQFLDEDFAKWGESFLGFLEAGDR
ncbi:MAG: alpha/beta hydrolase [Rhodospirillaceae bacterium]|nr:alpha/beta hydrolase [Rhodospirillaceae bacterium]